jgi:hypothetical protein
VDYQSGPERPHSKGCRHFMWLTVFNQLMTSLCSLCSLWPYSKGEADSVSDRREVYARLLELRLPISRASAERGRGHG